MSGKHVAPRLSYSRSAQLAAPSWCALLFYTPCSTQQCSDLRPYLHKREMLMGSYLWAPGVCVNMPGARWPPCYCPVPLLATLST